MAALMLASAASGAQAERRRLSNVAPEMTISSSGLCKVAIQTDAGPIAPPDDGTADNEPASVVRMAKPCVGPVAGTFTAEVNTAVEGAFLHIDMRATCLDSGGMANACEPGQTLFASPGHSLFQNGQAQTSVHTIQMAWPVLRKGTWRFEVLPGGGGGAYVDLRTFRVDAFGAADPAP
jgi:hypothetical protein